MNVLTKIFFLGAVSLLFLLGDIDTSTQFGFRIIKNAEAVVGRPITPVSVAGVRRRTRRRTAAVMATTPVVAPVVVPVPVEVEVEVEVDEK